MSHAIKLRRFSSQLPFFHSASGLSSITNATKAASVRFVQVTSHNKEETNYQNMDKSKDQQDQNLNVMKESFGEGYATRSDEEGFGGIYGGNDEENAEMKIIQDPAHHDNKQGSEVNEKEKARNQTNVN